MLNRVLWRHRRQTPRDLWSACGHNSANVYMEMCFGWRNATVWLAMEVFFCTWMLVFVGWFVNINRTGAVHHCVINRKTIKPGSLQHHLALEARERERERESVYEKGREWERKRSACLCTHARRSSDLISCVCLFVWQTLLPGFPSWSVQWNLAIRGQRWTAGGDTIKEK